MGSGISGGHLGVPSGTPPANTAQPERHSVHPHLTIPSPHPRPLIIRWRLIRAPVPGEGGPFLSYMVAPRQPAPVTQAGSRETATCPGVPRMSEAGVTLKRVRVWSTPEVQAVSRMECMASWGLPKSRTRSPSREAKIGPMVVPQGESFRTMRS